MSLFSEWKLTNKLFAGATDNASNICKAIWQLGCIHIGCMAHTIQLAINTELSQIKETLVAQAKSLNNFLVNRDKYQDTFDKIQAEINEQNGLPPSQHKLLDAIGGDTITR